MELNLQISVKYISPVKRLEAFDDLNCNAPYLLFLEGCSFLLMLNDFLVKIAIICIFHNDAALAQRYHRVLVASSTNASL
jgi:hypothetical protein